MTHIQNKRLKNVLYAFYVIVVIYIFAVTVGCQSQSGKLNDTPLEKVIIIDSKTITSYDNGRAIIITSYKVKRINHGVVDWFNETGKPKYEQGDTIYHKFIKYSK